MDIGTGDGRAVLARAAAEPRSLVLGVDAAAAGMSESSRRAQRGRVGNAVFLVAGAESLARSPLAGVAALVTVTMPWASLLRGVLGADPVVLAGVASVVAPGGRVEVLLSAEPRDGFTLPPEARIRDAWADAGLFLDMLRPAGDGEILASGSTWARRLLHGGPRPTAGREILRLAGARSARLTLLR